MDGPNETAEKYDMEISQDEDEDEDGRLYMWSARQREEGYFENQPTSPLDKMQNMEQLQEKERNNIVRLKSHNNSSKKKGKLNLIFIRDGSYISGNDRWTG